MFVLEQVNKSFEDQACIRDLDLSVPAGTTTVLIGPSGCGKSTLLKLMLGLLYPDRGSVRFDDQAVQPDNARALRQRMGCAPSPTSPPMRWTVIPPSCPAGSVNG